MAFQYIRDLSLSSGLTYDGAWGACMVPIFHLLRLMGWTWLWECDGHTNANNPNPIADGNMEASGVASWATGAGSTITKITTDYAHGSQCLRWQPDPVGVDSLGATGFIATAHEGRRVQVGFWFKTTTAGFTSDVNYGGVWHATGLTIIADGAWHYYQTQFYVPTQPITLGVDIRWVSPGGAPNDAFLDGVVFWFSYFENGYALERDLTDGVCNVSTTEFSSSSYTFVVGDVGKVIVVYDASNPENTGAWKILSINAGAAVCDLRGLGSPTFTAASSLPWRLIDPVYFPYNDSELGMHCGFGLESPYQNWRMFMRNNATTQNAIYAGIVCWTSPGDVDFDFGGNGEFYAGEANTFDVRSTYLPGNPLDCYHIAGDGYYRDNTVTRLYLMTDDAGTFVVPVLRSGNGTLTHGWAFMGYTGADTYHALEESFLHVGETQNNAGDDMRWHGVAASSRYGASPVPSGDYMIDSVLPVLAHYNSWEESDFVNARRNPFSRQEYLRKVAIIRDWEGYRGYPSVKTLDDHGQWVSRMNMSGDFDAFDSDVGGGDGVTDAFTGAPGTITLTIAGAGFTAAMVGKKIIISGSTSPANDGTFTITAVPGATQVQFVNGGAPVNEVFGGEWEVNMHRYMHLMNGWCWEWPGIEPLA